jgi:hypothetical protein
MNFFAHKKAVADIETECSGKAEDGGYGHAAGPAPAGPEQKLGRAAAGEGTPVERVEAGMGKGFVSEKFRITFMVVSVSATNPSKSINCFRQTSSLGCSFQPLPKP